MRHLIQFEVILHIITAWYNFDKPFLIELKLLDERVTKDIYASLQFCAFDRWMYLLWYLY
jgi:hypothetical protein